MIKQLPYAPPLGQGSLDQQIPKTIRRSVKGQRTLSANEARKRFALIESYFSPVGN
ncbi:hypothetical protein [Pseudomonas viridiflava]|uniref:hypothetical protein n=1 Tax=Pseudomonas viridiflava TaxID=33069 RepID=UPI001F11E3FF|nr:hypothetical protein [Pseudomonas viridiflava]